MNIRSRSSQLWAALAAFALAVTLSSWSYAGVVQSGPGTWKVTVGSSSFSGVIAIDPESGNIAIPDGFNLRDDASGASLILSKLDGNADPTIGFGLLGITGASPAAFSATFSIPVDLVGPILAQSNASYTVTRLGTTPSTLSPSHAFTVTSQDTNSNTGDDINKGVDIGDTFIVAAPKIADTITFPSTTSFKENVFVAPAGTDLFSVEVAFTLTKDTSASVTGVVHQTAVPEPSTYGLLAAGLAFVGFMTRRRLSA